MNQGLIGDSPPDGVLVLSHHSSSTRPKFPSKDQGKPSKEPEREPESEDDSAGWGKGWETKPNYGFEGPLPAVPDPPLWKDDPPEWLTRKTAKERRELEKAHRQPAKTIPAIVENGHKKESSSTHTN